MKEMNQAVEQLKAAQAGPSAGPLTTALASEQAAYQDILKLRAREFEVVRQQRQQGQQGKTSASSGQQRQPINLIFRISRTVIRTSGRRSNSSRNSSPSNSRAGAGPAARDAARCSAACAVWRSARRTSTARCAEAQASLQEAQEQPSARKPGGNLPGCAMSSSRMLRDTDELRDRLDEPQNQGQEQMADAANNWTRREMKCGGRPRR